MRLLGSHLNLCDPREFHRAWEALGDLNDEDCERVAALNEALMNDCCA